MYPQSSCPVPPGRSRVSATGHSHRTQSVERLSSAGTPGLLCHSHRTPVSQPHCEEESSRTASMPLCTDWGCVGRHCIPGQMPPFGCYRISRKPLAQHIDLKWLSFFSMLFGLLAFYYTFSSCDVDDDVVSSCDGFYLSCYCTAHRSTQCCINCALLINKQKFAGGQTVWSEFESLSQRTVLELSMQNNHTLYYITSNSSHIQLFLYV